MTNVVIIGGGFLGLAAAKQLAGDERFAVTLISDRANFEYHAALYRSATGRSPLEVSVPLIEIADGVQNLRVVQGEACDIDAKKKTVKTKSGDTYKYDELIVGTGTVTAYFNIPGLKENSYSLKTTDDAMALRRHLRNELIAGETPDRHYVVVGAGPSGVELAGELTSYLRRLRKRYDNTAPFSVDLVEAAPRILPSLPEPVARRVDERLRELGVTIYTSTAVKGETADTLKLPNGNLKTHTVIWTAGMANNPLCGENAKVFTLGPRGKVVVDANLAARPHVWVGGDSAATEHSGWGQTAAYDGRYIATNLQRAASAQDPLPYRPPQPVGAIPVGPNWCAVSASDRQLYGYRGWMVRRWLDLDLYRQIMPNKLALRAWLKGTQRQAD